MGDRFRKGVEVRRDELQRLMNCIVEHAAPGEARDVERLLSALVTVSAGPDRAETVSFVPPKGTAPIVERALAAMQRADRHAARARR